MSNVDNELKQLISAIKETETYQEYRQSLDELNRDPELKEYVDGLRSRNFKLQNREEYSPEEFEKLEKEYEECMENPAAMNFMTSELAFCRMMQEIYLSLTEAMQFD